VLAVPAPYLTFPYPAILPTPLAALSQAPLNSVVCLVLELTCTSYSGNPWVDVSGTRSRTHSEQTIAFATGHIIEGNPTRILTVGHVLWSIERNVAGGPWTERHSTSILAIPVQSFAALGPLQQKDMHALRAAGGQTVFAFQTVWPTLDEIYYLNVARQGHLDATLDLALLHVPRPFRSGAPGPHLEMLPMPVIVQQNLPPLRRDLIPLLQDMRSVVFGHAPTLTADPGNPAPGAPGNPWIPKFAAMRINPHGEIYGAGIIAVLGQSAVKGFSGGPVCLPPGANVFHAGQHIGEDGALCRNVSMEGGRPIILKWMISGQTKAGVSS
jgi:hypothetical protein